MHECSQCGGRLRRVHRTFSQRLSYRAVYSCAECHKEEFVVRTYALHMGGECRCPQCGTFRLVRLKERDHIDKMQAGLFNLLERIAGGGLYHCRYCRLQFYDRRRLAARSMKSRATGAAQPDAAQADLE